MDNYRFSGITGQIINAFFQVYKELGYGFLEKVYENALCFELRSRDFSVDSQQPTRVYYRNVVVGDYYSDLIVDGKIIIEVKSVEKITEAHTAQLLNYLKATRLEVGLILNFGPRSAIARRVFSGKTTDQRKAVKSQSNKNERKS